jgi:hypothetical protein
MRRAWVALVLVAVLVLAGCNAGPGDRTPAPIEATASEATVPGGALSDAGFSASGVEEVQADRSDTLSVSGDVEMDLGYQVRATGWRAGYRSPDGGTVFALYTVPLAEPERADAQIDPLGDHTTPEVVAEAQTGYSDPSGLEHERNRTVTVLGAETTVQQFSGTATRDGETAEVTVYLATVDHESDRVRAVGVEPRDVDSWETLRTLFENVSH